MRYFISVRHNSVTVLDLAGKVLSQQKFVPNPKKYTDEQLLELLEEQSVKYARMGYDVRVAW